MAGSEGLHGLAEGAFDTTLDKHYARRMELVTHHWSGKHQWVVQGIALLTLIPCDFRVYDQRQGGKTNLR